MAFEAPLHSCTAVKEIIIDRTIKGLIFMSILCRFIFWKEGGHTTTQQGITSVLGALYASVIFLGIINSIVLQPIAAENRGVLYRERAAGVGNLSHLCFIIQPVEFLLDLRCIKCQFCTFEKLLYLAMTPMGCS